MEDLQKLSVDNINKLVEKLCNDEPVRCNLPGGGKINIEKPLPYLLIYRLQENGKDPGTVRLILSEPSYLLIGHEDFKGYQQLLNTLAGKLASKYNSYLLFELWSGAPDSQHFRIKGPADRIPSTIAELENQLQSLDGHYDQLALYCEVNDTEDRHPPNSPNLLSIEELKNAGCLLVGMEIPPVFRSRTGQLYPLFFRSFHDQLAHILHLVFYDFIRVQTSSGVSSYSSLGRATVDRNALEIDQKLCEIEKQFQFLWLVSPANIHEVKQRFFESNFQEVPDYHYRLLPIDPDVVKRELYNLRIEDVADPALSLLFRDKREELDLQITMLNQRGTRDFYYSSICLYKGVESPLLAQAREILEKVEETETTADNNLIGAEEFGRLSEKEFKNLQQQDEHFHSKVHIRKDVNVIMVSKGELFIPADYKMPRQEAEALIQHEIGTHVLTHYNGRQQILQQLAYGLADYDALQEGLAVMAEYLVGGLSANRLRILAARVVAGAALSDGASFQEIFRQLSIQYGLTAERAFNVTSRIMQGGGFLKDIIYLHGLVQLRQYLQDGGELEPLLLGKIAVKHISIMNDLRERGLLQPPQLIPSYLNKEETRIKINKIREGLPLPQMISA